MSRWASICITLGETVGCTISKVEALKTRRATRIGGAVVTILATEPVDAGVTCRAVTVVVTTQSWDASTTEAMEPFRTWVVWVTEWDTSDAIEALKPWRTVTTTITLGKTDAIQTYKVSTTVSVCFTISVGEADPTDTLVTCWATSWRTLRETVTVETLITIGAGVTSITSRTTSTKDTIVTSGATVRGARTEVRQAVTVGTLETSRTGVSAVTRLQTLSVVALISGRATTCWIAWIRVENTLKDNTLAVEAVVAFRTLTVTFFAGDTPLVVSDGDAVEVRGTK